MRKGFEFLGLLGCLLYVFEFIFRNVLLFCVFAIFLGGERGLGFDGRRGLSFELKG